MINCAITDIELALREFQETTGLIPRVMLLPPRIYRDYERESKVLDSVLPTLECDDGTTWADVRVIEHEGVHGIEIY